MKLQILPAAALALLCATTLVVACGDDEPIKPDPINNTQTDTTVVDTTQTDTTQTDTTQIDTTEVETPVDSVVAITWTSSGASVSVDAALAGIIAYTVDGANVTVTNTNTTDEFLFVLSGTSDNGTFTYNGSYKTSFELNGLNLQASTGAAIDIQCGKRIKLILADGTENSLADAAGGTQKAALNCQGHMEVSGSGSLAIAGHTNHALRTKEYLQLKASTGSITISSAAADGIHCGEFFQMNGGTLTISGTTSDGLQVETDATSDEPLNGQFVMNGGSINLTLASADSKGIRLDADDTNASIVPHMQFLDGNVTVNLASTALGSKAIASDGNLTIGSSTTAPKVEVTVAAGTYTDPATGEENRATGIKAAKTLTIAGGATTVAASGAKSRGVRASTLTATGGTLTVQNTGSKSQGIKLDNVFVTGQGGTVSGKFKY